jgi:hypothetical protein
MQSPPKAISSENSKRCYDDNNATKTGEDETINYFSEAINMLTNELHKYTMGLNSVGEETKIITNEQVKKWCNQVSVQESNLPTWVKCKDVFLKNGRWYRVPDESASVRN